MKMELNVMRNKNIKNKNLSFDSLLKANRFQKYIINGKYEWNFLDEYTFSKFEKESNSPSFISSADGNVNYGKKNMIAKIVVMKHNDIDMMSGSLYTKDTISDENWKSMVNIVKIEEVK